MLKRKAPDDLLLLGFLLKKKVKEEKKHSKCPGNTLLIPRENLWNILHAKMGIECYVWCSAAMTSGSNRTFKQVVTGPARKSSSLEHNLATSVEDVDILETISPKLPGYQRHTRYSPYCISQTSLFLLSQFI